MIKYNMRLDEDRLPMLVREKSFRYKGGTELLNSPRAILNFLREKEDLCNRMEEHTYIICNSGKQKCIGYFELATGTTRSCQADARQLFMRILACGAEGFAFVHNHPSGDPTPSETDIVLTKQIKEAAALLNIQLLDSVVIGNNNYYSFLEQNLLN